MDQVILFDKSLQERFDEYLDILSGHETLTISQMKKEWSFYLELQLDPNGWQAIWKIPRLKCESLKIAYPTIVMVLVDQIDSAELQGTVSIIAVQDEISIPEKFIVPLIQLWPTREQDPSVVLNLKTTANVLDMLRFFYTSVVMPWDYEEDAHIDWLDKHLETRLRLFYDMKNGTIPKSTAEHLRSLLTEARRLHARIEYLESELSDEGFEDVDLNTLPTNTENSKIEEMMDIHLRMVQIKGEVEILENPLMRKILIRRLNVQSSEVSSKIPIFWLVYNKGTADEYILFLNKTKELFPTDSLRFTASLTTVAELVNDGDTLVLSKDTHVICSNGGFDNISRMCGLYHPDDTVLTTTIDDIMLDLCGEDVTLDSLTVSAKTALCAVLVRRGKTTLRNCKIIGNGESSTHQGIIVLAGARLVLVHCELIDFGTALIGNSGAAIVMTDCAVEAANVGLKVYDNCSITIQRCSFRNCKEYGMSVETQVAESQVGTFDILNGIANVTVENVLADNNGRADAIINRKSKMMPILNLFPQEQKPEVSNPNKRKASTSPVDATENIDAEADSTIIETA